MRRGSTWSATAATWIAKATLALEHEARQRQWQRISGVEAERLLQRILYAAPALADLISDDMLDDVTRLASDLARTLRQRRMAAKLSNVSGRTPEEAALFEAKARDLTG